MPRAFQFLDETPNVSAHRIETLDGLRGILATAVVFHHLEIKRWTFESGSWGLPPSHFYSILGQAGVSVFFMITGYLFWGRLVDRGSDIDWLKLYVNRFFRIVPLYLIVVFSYIAAVIYRADFHVQIPWTEFASQLIQWLAFGLVKQPPWLLGETRSGSIVGQTWTLYYEWIFYLALPLLAIFARARNPLAICIAALALIFNVDGLVSEPYRYYVEQFLCGMIAASLLRAYPDLKGDGPIRSLLALAAATCAFRFADTAYSTLAVVFLGVFFAFIASGTSLFGVLSLRGAKRLGHISYSIYLLHGLVLTVIMAPSFFGLRAASSPRSFWLVASCAYAIVIALSMTTFVIVERGGIRIGESICERRSQRGLRRA